MITCRVEYQIDPWKFDEFERNVRLWFPLLRKFGGTLHGFFLPSEGTNDVAIGLFSFPSLAAYEEYRLKSFDDEECRAAIQYAQQTRCFIRYERSFFRPVLEHAVAETLGQRW